MTTFSNDPATGAQPSAHAELNEILVVLGEPVTTREELERVGIDVDDEWSCPLRVGAELGVAAAIAAVALAGTGDVCSLFDRRLWKLLPGFEGAGAEGHDAGGDRPSVSTKQHFGAQHWV